MISCCKEQSTNAAKVKTHTYTPTLVVKRNNKIRRMYARGQLTDYSGRYVNTASNFSAEPRRPMGNA